MNRRKFVIGAAGTALGGSALVGSGAFSSVEADRDVEVAVADDSAAFLALEPGVKNGAYAQETGGTLEINFDAGADVAGEGFNNDATTILNDVFRVRNQGTQDVKVDISADEDDFDSIIIGDPDGSVALVETPSQIVFLVFSPAELPGGRNVSPDDPERTIEPGEALEINASFQIVDPIDELEELDAFPIEISAEATE